MGYFKGPCPGREQLGSSLICEKRIKEINAYPKPFSTVDMVPIITDQGLAQNDFGNILSYFIKKNVTKSI